MQPVALPPQTCLKILGDLMNNSGGKWANRSCILWLGAMRGQTVKRLINVQGQMPQTSSKHRKAATALNSPVQISSISITVILFRQ